MALPEYIVTASHRRMAEDFRLFLWYIWRCLGLPEPTPIQYDIALYLQHGPRRRIIEAFRGVGKSYITAAFVLWLLWRNPQLRIMVVSANEERALAFGKFVRDLIEQVDILTTLRPKDGARDSIKAFDVGPARPDQAPSVRCVGITGQLTGGRADLIVPDDVEIPKNSATELQREKLAEAVKEFDAVLKPNGQIVYLGTPQVTQSLYNTLEQRGYKIRVWPARYTNDQAVYRGNLAPMLVEALEKDPTLLGKPTEPSRFNEMELAEREASYGRSGFALQFMLDTSLNDANRHPLKVNDLVVMDVAKDLAPVALTWASGPQQAIADMPVLGFNGDRFHRPMYVSSDFTKYQGSVMHIDPSGRGADETAYVVTKMLNGFIYVRRWGGLQGGYDTPVLETLARIAQEEQVNEIVVEENFADGMFGALFAPVLNNIYPCTVTGTKVKGQKEVRIIDTLEPVLNQHRLVMDKAMLQKDYEHAMNTRTYFSGIYQLANITRDRGSLKHDDRIDVLAMGVEYWTKMIQNDVNKAEAAHREKLKQQQIRDFLKHNLGYKPRPRRWVSI